MKTMCKFKRTDGTTIALKTFGIELVEENAGGGTCRITVHGIQTDGEWLPLSYDVVGTIDQVCAEIDK